MKAAAAGPMQGILGYTEEPVVSSDFTTIPLTPAPFRWRSRDRAEQQLLQGHILVRQRVGPTPMRVVDLMLYMAQKEGHSVGASKFRLQVLRASVYSMFKIRGGSFYPFNKDFWLTPGLEPWDLYRRFRKTLPNVKFRDNAELQTSRAKSPSLEGCPEGGVGHICSRRWLIESR